MSERKIQLTVTSDGAGARADIQKTSTAVEGLGQAATTAGKTAASGINTIAAAAGSTGAKVDAATRNMISSIERTTAALESGSRTSRQYFETLAGQRGISADAIKPYLDTLDQATAKAAAAQKGVAGIGMSAAQTAAAMRMVPAQITDIVTGLASGQAPLTVMIQQGGQLKDMFGGIGPAARALTSSIVGMINPLTVAAGAAVALAVAYEHGSSETDAYAKALILSGNSAGFTTAQLQAMSKAIADSAGTQHAAADAVAQFAGAANISRDSLQKFANVALTMDRTIGQPVKDTVRQFEELGKAPVEASRKLDEALHYLTTTTYEQIKAFVEQGRAADAARLAQDTYADAMSSRMSDLKAHQGFIEQGWDGIKKAAAGAWDAMLAVGRDETPEDKIARLQARLEANTRRTDRADSIGPSGRRLGADSERAQILADLAAEKGKQQADQQEAARRAEQVATQSAGKAASDYFDRLQRGQKTTENLNRALAEYDQKLQALQKAGGTLPSEKQQAADKAKIRKEYTDESGTRSAGATRKAQLDADLELIRKAGELSVKEYAGTEKQLEAVRSAGLISEQDYFDRKRELITAEGEARGEELAREIARLQLEKATGAERVKIEADIAKAQAESAIVGADTSAKLATLEVQRQAGLGRTAAAYDAAKEAAEAFYQTSIRKQARELGGIGQGKQAREYASGLGDIEDRYAGVREKLSKQKARDVATGRWEQNADVRNAYEEQLALLRDYQNKEVAAYIESFAKKKEAMGEWTAGASEAMQNYLTDSADVAKQTENLFGNAFQSMEDSLVNFVKTGKLDFSSLVNTVLNGLIRIQVQKMMTQAMGGSGGSSSGGGTGWFGTVMSFLGGGRAEGGSVDAGGLYPVNERGPELLEVGGKSYLMMGAEGGHVTPNSGSSTGAAQVVHIHNNYTVGDVVSSQKLARVAEQTRRAAIAGMREAQSRGQM